MITIFTIILLSLLVIPTDSIALLTREEPWPEVMPLKQEIVFGSNGARAVGLYIFRADGVPLYLLECHDFRYSESHDTDFDYSGDFECRLTPLQSTTSYSTLLTDQVNQSRDWQSRARFLVQDLTGACSKYPDFGAVRQFRLRGMKITLALYDVVLDQAVNKTSPNARPGLKSFRFVVDVISDPSAVSDIAELSEYLPPSSFGQLPVKGDHSRACSKIRKR